MTDMQPMICTLLAVAVIFCAYAHPLLARNFNANTACDEVVKDDNVAYTFVGRVAAGSYPPAAPTDPGVPHSGTRLLR